MEKIYTIEWRNEKKTILEIKYMTDAVLKDILTSNVEAMSIAQTVAGDVALIHNSQGYNVGFELLGVGKIHDAVYSKFLRALSRP